MSRCRQTDELLGATFAGTDLTRAQAEHVRGCAECARAISQARRFENELGRVGAALAHEPMPAIGDMTSTPTTTLNGGTPMTLRRGLIGAFVTVAFVGIVGVAIIQLGTGIEPGSGTGEQAASLASPEAVLGAWLADVKGAAESEGREAWGDEPVHVLRADQCGETVTVVLEENEHDLWSVDGSLDAAGEAHFFTTRLIDAERLAREMAAGAAACAALVRSTISIADATEAVQRMGGIPGGWQVLAAAQLEEDSALVVVERSVFEGQWWMGVLRRTPEGWTGEPQEWFLADPPTAPASGIKVQSLRGIAPDAPATDALIALLPAGAVALEVDIEGVPHRYQGEPGATTMIVTLPRPITRQTVIRFLDADGVVIDEVVHRP